MLKEALLLWIKLFLSVPLFFGVHFGGELWPSPRKQHLYRLGAVYPYGLASFIVSDKKED
jgi:hypothetical protein